MSGNCRTSFFKTALLVSSVLAAPSLALADRNTAIDGNNGTLPLPTGQYVTPLKLTNSVQQPLNPGLPAYPNFVAGMAVRSQLSPDGSTLAIICAGMNSLVGNGAVDTANSTQYIFLYNVAGSNKTSPVLQQVIKQVNSWVGLVFSTDGNTLYAAGGADDSVYYYTKSGSGFALGGTIPLGHGANKSGSGLGSGVQPNAGGLGLSADGTRLVVANNYNDSISVIDTAAKTVLFEHDLRPYLAYNEGTDGVAGGTFPYTVVVKGSGAGLVAYVSSDRDREVDVVAIGTAPGSLIKRIKLPGNAEGMTFNADQSLLYVAQDNADQVAIINTASNAVVGTIDARAPASAGLGAKVTGASTTAVTISNNVLYAVNSGANTIAVIPLTGANANTVTGLIPTAYEPHDVTFSADGSWMYVINGKNDTGGNPQYPYGGTPVLTSAQYPGGNTVYYGQQAAKNQYQFQLERATLVSGAVPTASDLPMLTAQSALNNSYPSSNPDTASDAAVMSFLRSRIQHVIYIVKENRTFDQILGDLGNGSNADPSLALFGKRITPSFHRMAQQFVTLDNFMDPGDGSMDGWSWSLQGRVTNTETITQQINYALVNRGLSYESEGTNRNVPVQIPLTGAITRDTVTNGSYSTNAAKFPGGVNNLLAGPGDHAATDAPYGVQLGYIFDAVLQAGGTVRNYGFLTNNIGAIKDSAGNAIVDPYTAGVVQVAPLNPALLDKTDVYFRGYDQAYPDLWRFNEWNREFKQYVTNGQLPSLSLVRLAHDHTGSYAAALGGVNTPETQQADNDYSVARVVQAVSNSPYASNTLIIITEDDCQDGADHFDSHRATAYMVGPYVKTGAVVSTRYNQVSVLRTIEDILGTPHINLNTAYQRPMADVFNTSASGFWSFTAIASRYLANTTLMLAENPSEVQFAEGPDVTPTHDAAYWQHVSRGFDFSDADRVPPALYNEVLWNGLMEGVPYPAQRSGLNLGRSAQAAE